MYESREVMEESRNLSGRRPGYVSFCNGRTQMFNKFKKVNKFWAVLLSLAVMVGMIPGMSASAFAADKSSDTVFTVYTQTRTGDPVVAKEYTKDDLYSLASTGTNGYLYAKGDNDWSVWGATKYVSIDKLLTDAKVDLTDDSVMQANAKDNYNYTIDNNVINKSGDYYFFPKAAKGGTSTDDAVTVPACIGLEWDGGASIDADGTAGAKASALCGSAYYSGNLRLFTGTTAADYQAKSGTSVVGARSVSNMTGITVVDKGDADSTVRFMQSGTKQWDTKYFKSGEKLILPTSDPTKDGDTFAYWYYLDSSNNEVKVDANTTVSGDMTVYAKWKSEVPTVWDGKADTSWYNTTDTSFDITTAEQLAGLAQIVNGTADGIEKDDFKGKTVNLKNDLTMNDKCYSAASTEAKNWTPIGLVDKGDIVSNGTQNGYTWEPFAGTFNGEGHVVKNLYCAAPNPDNYDEVAACYRGLFGNITGTVKYLGVTGYISAGRMPGGIAAYNNGVILGCYNACTVKGNGSGSRPGGGVAGLNDGIIAYSYNSGAVAGGAACGGIAGNTKYTGSLIYSCFNTGKVTGRGNTWTGGITASDCESRSMPLGTVSNCYWLTGMTVDNYATALGYAAQTTAYEFGTDGNLVNKQVNNATAALTENDPTTLLGGINADGRDMFISDNGTNKLFWEKSGFDYAAWNKASGSADISAGTCQNGTVELSSSGTMDIGTKVTAAAKPAAGYKATSFTYTYIDSDGNTVKTKTESTGAVNGSDQKANFLAYSNVKVTATFEKLKTATLKIDDTDDYTINLTDANGNALKNGDTVTEGDKINLASVTFKDGAAPADTDYRYDDKFSATVTNWTKRGDYGEYYIAGAEDTMEFSMKTYTTHKTFDDGTAAIDTTWYDRSENASSYTISTPQQLAGLAYLVNRKGIDFEGKTITMSADIDMSKFTTTGTYWWQGIGASYNVYAPINETVTADNLDAMKAKYGIVAKKTYYYNSTTGFTQYGQVTADNTDFSKVKQFYTYSVFKGTFDGSGHSISGLMNQGTAPVNGLFGSINGATVKNVTVNGTFTTPQTFGGIAGQTAGKSVIKNCVSKTACSGSAYAQNIGGIVGSVSSGGTKISNCTFSGSIAFTGSGYYMAGIAGSISGGAAEIAGCTNKGSVSCASGSNVAGIAGSMSTNYSAPVENILKNCTNDGTVSGASNTGGIAASMGSGPNTITNCVNNGSVTATGEAAGGIIGNASGYPTNTISRSVNHGKVTAARNSGGIAGRFQSGTLKTCSNDGDITATALTNNYGVGGIAGSAISNTCTISNSYNMGDITAAAAANRTTAGAGGVVGVLNSAKSVTNCYSTGSVTGGQYVPNAYGVIGYAMGTGTAVNNVDNCYFLNEEGGTLTDAKATARTADEMKSADFVTELNGSDNAYLEDIASANSGYPVLRWQTASKDSIDLAKTLFPDADGATIIAKAKALDEYNAAKTMTAVINAIDAIGKVTTDSGSAISNARSLYDNAVADEHSGDYIKDTLEDGGYQDTLEAAESAYDTAVYDAAVSKSVTKVEKLIDAIGTVATDSGAAITKARNAYNDAVADDTYGSGIEKQLKTDGYDTKLTDAENAYAAAVYTDAVSKSVTKVETLIDAIGTVDKNSGAALTKAQDAYDEAAADETYGEAVKARLTADGYTGKLTLAADSYNAKLLSKATISIDDVVYDGSAQKPEVTLTDAGGNVIAPDQYKVFYEGDNTNAGTCDITVRAISGGNYTGTIDTTFDIAPVQITADAIASVADQTYTGKALVPAVNVTAAGFSLEAGKDYTAAYTKNKYTGKAAVTVTGTGNFTGTATKTFRIVPARAKIKSIKAGKGNFTVEVRNQAKSKASGYQVTYKKKGSSKWKSVKTRSVKKTVNNLKRWRYFTVKARAYKKISGEVVYGKYSAARKIFTK